MDYLHSLQWLSNPLDDEDGCYTSAPSEGRGDWYFCRTNQDRYVAIWEGGKLGEVRLPSVSVERLSWLVTQIEMVNQITKNWSAK